MGMIVPESQKDSASLEDPAHGESVLQTGMGLWILILVPVIVPGPKPAARAGFLKNPKFFYWLDEHVQLLTKK